MRYGIPRGIAVVAIEDFPGLIKNNMEFPEVIKEKTCGISRGRGFKPYNF